MKKPILVTLSVLAALALLLAGLFFYRGGHHALVVSEALEQWLDADSADQTLTLQFTHAGFHADDTADLIRPGADRWTLTADTFWTEYADDEIFGLTAGGITAYLRKGILYMDTGRAYALPDGRAVSEPARRLAYGLLLYGRMTKDGNTYHLTMDTDELYLRASVTLDRTLQHLTLSAAFPDGSGIYADLTPREVQSHPIPRTVTDAMVRAQMEQPMSLSEPVELLLPALEHLLPLTGKLDLRIASGILELSETVDLSIANGNVCLSRGGVLVELPLDPDALSPAALGLLALRNGDFSTLGNTSSVTVTLPGETVAELTAALIPQTSGLDILFHQSSLVLTITDGKLTQASIGADGEVPFLFTAIPLSFSAELHIT